MVEFAGNPAPVTVMVWGADRFWFGVAVIVPLPIVTGTVTEPLPPATAGEAANVTMIAASIPTTATRDNPLRRVRWCFTRSPFRRVRTSGEERGVRTSRVHPGGCACATDPRVCTRCSRDDVLAPASPAVPPSITAEAAPQ